MQSQPAKVSQHFPPMLRDELIKASKLGNDAIDKAAVYAATVWPDLVRSPYDTSRENEWALVRWCR